MSGRLWNTRYGSDPSILGRVIRVNGVSATVVGVMPEAFRLPGNTDVWLPLAQTPEAMREA